MQHLAQVFSYIYQMPNKKFFQKTYQYGANLNYLKMIQTFCIEYDLIEEQYTCSFYLIYKINIKYHNHKDLPGDLQRFVNCLTAYSPSEQWLYRFVEKNGIILKKQETLEV